LRVQVEGTKGFLLGKVIEVFGLTTGEITGPVELEEATFKGTPFPFVLTLEFRKTRAGETGGTGA
jgi:hypothetical protein